MKIDRLCFLFSLRYEMALSMAILNDPGHHILQRNWFEKTRVKLPESVFLQIRDLFLYSHEAVIIRVLSRCEDSMDEIQSYLLDLSKKSEDEIFQLLFAEENLDVATEHLSLFKKASSGRISDEAREFFQQEFGVQGDEEIIGFSRKYASPRSFILKLRNTLSSYWDNFFEREWLDNLLPELKRTIASFNDVKVIDLLSFVEEQTGKRFKEFSEVTIYVSNFIDPHGMGFMEKERMGIIVDKNLLMEKGITGVYHTIIHETLHKLMQDIRGNTEIQSEFEKLKENAELMKLYRETVMGRYGWNRFVEENITVALERFLLVKLKVEEESEAREMLYTGLQMALFDELNKNYSPETYGNIDNFLLQFFKNRDLRKVRLPKELQEKLFKYLSSFSSV